MTRPDYVRCIQLHSRETYCSRKADMFEWMFVDPEHARLNEEQKGRLVTCPECKRLSSRHDPID